MGHRRAADQGDPGAQNNLAILYEQGLGVDRSRNRAVELLRLAASQGHRVAEKNLIALGVSPETASN